LYGCETWSLTLREENRLRVLENRVLGIFGPKREAVAGGWRRLHDEELHNLYTSTNSIRAIKSRIGWVGHVASIGDTRNAYNVKPIWKRLLGRARRTWEDNINMDLRETG
jgi:hypothetical protein